MLAAALLALMAGPASAEGHHCRFWQYDTYYGGYWMYLQCPGEEGRYNGWYPEIPSQLFLDGYEQFLDPYYY